jgi:hypothetical protein
MLLTFNEQEDLSVAYFPNSAHPQHPSPRLAQCKIDQELDQSGTRSASLEELSYSTLLQGQLQEEAEERAIPLEQHLLGKVIDVVGAVEDSSSKSEHAEQAEKRLY